MPKLKQFQPGSFEQEWSPGGRVERHTSVCSHCQHITEFPDLRTMFQYVDVCRSCMKLICLHCVGGICMPYEKFCEQVEEQGYRDYQYRKALGL